jgi:hypothetical protein
MSGRMVHVSKGSEAMSSPQERWVRKEMRELCMYDP